MSTDDFTVVHAVAAGLDVHKLQITAAVRRQTPNGEFEVLVREFNTRPSGLQTLCKWLRSQHVDAALMEGTGVYWQAPFEAMENAAIPVMLVNAQQVKQLKGRKTDVNDSTWLARVCQFGLCQPSMVPPQPFRDLRNLARHKRRLVALNASIRNRVHKVLDRSGCQLGGCLTDIFGKNGRLVMKGLMAGWDRERILASLSHHVQNKLGLLGETLNLSLSENDRFLLEDLITSHDEQLKRIQLCQQRLLEALAPWQRQLQLLQTIPGIDVESACGLLAEMGPDLSVFANVKRFAAWAGVSPGNHESAGKRKRASIRHGSRHLSSLLVEAAHAASRTKGCQFQGYFQHLRTGRGTRKAAVATAHKLLRTIWAVLRSDEPYRDPGVNYEELLVNRNAARWIRQLRHFDYIQDAKVVFPKTGQATPDPAVT